MFKSINKWFKSVIAGPIERAKIVSDSLKTLQTATGKDLEKIRDKILSDPALRKTIMSDDAQEIFKGNEAKGSGSNKSLKEIFYHFFGMNETWPFWRNLLGGAMVHSPEWPTYFIPAFTQSKATGNATDLKKGEGPRGLITGALEGIAVGALVSGRKMKFKEMGPYIILGTALQLFSSKFFSWAGEKAGQYQYYKKNPKLAPPNAISFSKLFKQEPPQAQNPVALAVKPAFKGKAYASSSSNRMKV